MAAAPFQPAVPASSTGLATEPTGVLLVFPINVDASARFVEAAHALGFRVVGASSEATEPGLFGIDALDHLPYITEPVFAEAFGQLLSRHGVTHVFSGHQGVWAHLDVLLKSGGAARLAGDAAAPALCGPHPHALVYQELHDSQTWAAMMAGDRMAEAVAPDGCTVAPPMPLNRYVGLHRQFARTPGQCDDAKLHALCAIARVAPAGDVVEIGSLYGRSALALGWLAWHYRLGATVAVDPWGFDEARDQGDQAGILNGDGVVIDFERIFQNFLASASLVPGMGYIRKPSESAVADYRAAARLGQLASPGLDTVPLRGTIGMLHIDGNHAFDSVAADVRAWADQLVPGGWLLLDDYVWAFGDGPQRVGDGLLGTGRYDLAFTCGDTLFLRTQPPPA